ncbi:hypothetical protein PRZ48_009476 [Zasmidium cellare]|uniref:SnoaL-like domain-containing protein n=1 Tax=Zasmidium cellare TaxID=395010 RepID=A0ABR0EBU0_ZASCE|nr:hypothetical protein PRZ48_009476 [Zasmidium cellare]
MASTDADFAALSERLARAWASSWSIKDASTFTALCTRTGTWTDHSFRVTRTGTTSLANHYNLWLHANPDFHVPSILSIYPTPQGCVMKYIGKGTMTGDLAGRWPATGKAFEFVGFCEFVVSREEGLIEKLEEVYCRDYWDSRLEGYRSETKI